MKLAIALVSLFTCCSLSAQLGYWGVGNINNPWPYESQHGFIYRTNADGDSLIVVHEFDQSNGKYPFELIQASNGKLYGATFLGGENNAGVIFEYDLEHDAFRVVHHFLPGSPATPYPLPSSGAGLAEVLPGVIYGQVTGTTTVPAPGGHVFSYNINTETVSSVVAIPGFNGGSWNDAQNNNLRGKFFKASNGFVYAAGARNSTCPVGQPDRGSIFRINTNNNSVSTVYLNQCSGTDGFQYNSSYIEQDGKLYGTAGGGAGIAFPGNVNGYGILYSFDIQNNTYSKTYEFEGGDEGEDPHPELFAAADGKWYGTTQRGGSSDRGTIYAFDPETNEAEVKKHFEQTNPSSQLGPYGRLLLLASNGKLYGTNSYGLFTYDPVSNTLEKAFRKPRFSSNTLIEVCQKPSFKAFADYAYTLCEGTLFSHDHQSPNYETITWTHNGEVVSSQTNANLTFSEISSADAGIWQVTLTNECGVITPPSISLEVLPSTPETITSEITPSGGLSFCPGDTLVLSGNQGGVWNTGETTPTLQVTQPGSYQITNENACGVTYSNVVTVDTLYMPLPVITAEYMQYCPGDSMVVYSNVEGLWNNGEYGSEITVPADPWQTYFQISDWGCRIDTSNAFNLPPTLVAHYEPLPEISYEGSTQLCTGETLTLTSNNPQILYSVYYWYWMRLLPNGTLQYVSGDPTYQVTAPGSYVLQQRTPCNVYHYSDTLVVEFDTNLPSPVITTDATELHICVGDSIVLHTDAPNPVWSNGHTQPELVVYDSGTFTVSASNGCGTVTSAPISILVSASAPLSNVSWEQELATMCTTEAAIALEGGWPEGGQFSGSGVSGSVFSPGNANAGNNILTYTYTNEQGCSGIAQTSVWVDTLVTLAPTVLVLQPDASILYDPEWVNTCEGDEVILIPIPALPGEWSGVDSLNDFAIQNITESGTFAYRYTNACGASPWSVDVQVEFTPTEHTLLPTPICAGDTVEIAGVAYFDEGVFFDTLTTVAGCDSILIILLMHDAFEINDGIFASDSSLTAAPQDSLWYIQETVWYQWVDCNNGFAPIEGATDHEFFPTETGSYAVLITSSGCGENYVQSECLDFIVLSARNETYADALSIYPNPARDEVFVESALPISHLKIIDISGRTIAEHQPRIERFALDLDGYSSGIYLLQIHTTQGVLVKKLVIGEM